MRASRCMHEFRVTIVTLKMGPVKVKLKHQLSCKLLSEGGRGHNLQAEDFSGERAAHLIRRDRGQGKAFRSSELYHREKAAIETAAECTFLYVPSDTEMFESTDPPPSPGFCKITLACC